MRVIDLHRASRWTGSHHDKTLKLHQGRQKTVDALLDLEGQLDAVLGELDQRSQPTRRHRSHMGQHTLEAGGLMGSEDDDGAVGCGAHQLRETCVGVVGLKSAEGLIEEPDIGRGQLK